MEALKNIIIGAIKVITILFLLFVYLIFPEAYERVSDTSVVLVNGEAITESEIEQQFRLSLFYGRENNKSLDELKAAIIEELIDRHLILQKAREDNIKVSKDDIELTLGEIMHMYDSPEEFERAIDKASLSLEELRKRLENDLLIKITEERILDEIDVTEEEVKKYYEEHKDILKQPELIRLSAVIVETEEEAQLLLDKIKEGREFAELSKDESLGVNIISDKDMGHFARGQMSPEIERIAFSLKEGGVSQPIPVKEGYQLLRLEERLPGSGYKFEDIKGQLPQRVLEEKQQQVLSDWLKQLRDKAEIIRCNAK